MNSAASAPENSEQTPTGLEVDVSELMRVKQELRIRKQNSQSLVSTNEDLRKRNDDMGERMEELKQENSELLRSISDYGRNIDELKVQNRSSKALMSQYVFNLAQTKQKLTLLEASHKLQCKRVNQLEAEKKALNEQNRALNQAFSSTRKEIAQAYDHHKKRSFFAELFGF